MKMRRKLQLLILLVATLTATYAFADELGFGVDSADSALNGGTHGGGTTGGGTGTTTGGSTTGSTTGGGTGTTTGGSTTGTTTGGSTTGTTTGGGTGTSTGGTTGGDLGCTRTQGYWGSSPAGQARLIQLVGVSGMDLGDVHYTAAELDAILDAPSGGNALRSLSQQLIAAKLNVLNGADDSVIADDIAAADDLIGNLSSPPVGSDVVAPNSALGQQMLAVKDELDDYNNGNLNVPHCN